MMWLSPLRGLGDWSLGNQIPFSWACHKKPSVREKKTQGTHGTPLLPSTALQQLWLSASQDSPSFCSFPSLVSHPFCELSIILLHCFSSLVSLRKASLGAYKSGVLNDALRLCSKHAVSPMVLTVLFPGALLTLPFLLQGIDSFSTALELGSPTHLLLWEDPLRSLDSPTYIVV